MKSNLHLLTFVSSDNLSFCKHPENIFILGVDYIETIHGTAKVMWLIPQFNCQSAMCFKSFYLQHFIY